jgi:hypothetical protein
VENQDFALLNAEQDASYPIARKVASQIPQAVTHCAAQGHPHRPTVLHPHEVLADGIPVALV